ncbi:unnamed protein product [Mytilus edulis]|uniref:Uncharacterized protein n=1 Tax=Mytilus edulis TaxID=6550 RepID=A0A8S3V1N4_MYTED|nr:unnamed protein product [Mytilus edulis]
MSQQSIPTEDWTKIKDAVNKGSYQDFDIPLIYTILRNIHYTTLEPTNGWDSKIDPQPHQMKTGDDLERCRRRRNKIIHRGNTEVSDQKLHDYFDEFGAIASRLQIICNKKNNEFVLEVEDLRNCSMDEDTERKYLEEIEEWRCRSLESMLVISESTDEDSGTYTLKLGSKTSSCVLSITERIPSLIKLRKYQEELAEIAVTSQNTIICVGTNAGKTYVAYHIIEDHLIKYPEGKVVFINKTNVLLEQQYSRACKVFKDLNFQLYVECLEMNSILEIDNVNELLTDAYGLFSYESQQAKHYTRKRNYRSTKRIQDSCIVKQERSAKAPAKRLPHCLKATHFRRGTKSKDKADELETKEEGKSSLRLL